MSTEVVVNVMSEGMFVILKVAVPILLVSLIIGLIISIFQTMTSIQEQTLTFVPKIIGVFVGLMALGNYMLSTMSNYTIDLWSDFTKFIR